MSANDSPLMSMLLITYNQERYVRDAVRGALAQTYTPLEIVISDDGSVDGTFREIQRELETYTGPHRIILNRNPRNLGISGHLGSLWPRVAGELVFVAAGDDISAPERCEKVARYWLAHGCQPDLIATDLATLDSAGRTGGRVVVEDLDGYRNVEAWFAHQPRVVGAAHVWSRRLMQAFPPLPAGSWEDQLMVFRAVLAGGAAVLHEPLVLYRDGGQSAARRAYTAAQVAQRLLANSARARVEIPQMIRDAESVGAGDKVAEHCGAKLARETFVHAMLTAPDLREKLRLLFARFAAPVAAAVRVRVFVYAACPVLLSPLFFFKRRLARCVQV
ncbi:MAG: glycosyltransferase [Nevskiaceae bacterium]|nr:MAG: glycosyltransferase [Nevskiaceae bacterium]TBR74237.1 MAG: glycosyltransferase [Nevskiaceae bacterium]